jgi:S1-C subfamily serine protease
MNRRSLFKWTISALALAAGSFMASATLGSHFRTMPVADVAWPGSMPPAGPQMRLPSLFAYTAGTAFSVAPGVLVTNAHVTLPCSLAHRPVQVAGYQETWQVVRQDQDLDLALLRGSGDPAIPPLPVSAASQIARGAWALVLGFPADAASGSAYGVLGRVQRAAIVIHRPGSGQAESFRIMNRMGQPVDPTWQDGAAFFGQAGAERMHWALEIAATIGHVASGGPIVDGVGNVVGVIVADGTSPGSVSAIPVADLIDFLGAADIIPRFAPPPQAGDVDWRRAYRRAAPSVVRVGC